MTINNNDLTKEEVVVDQTEQETMEERGMVTELMQKIVFTTVGM